MSKLINWVIDTLASDDVIDLYFIISDLVDVDISEDEACQTASYDALATQTAADHSGDSRGGVPIGKMVL